MSPSIRIGLSITALTVTVLLVSDAFFGIFPGQHSQKLEARKEYCESIAIQFSSLVESGEYEAIQSSMMRLVERNPEVVSLGLRLADDQLVASAGGHESNWNKEGIKFSTPTHALVPIFEAGQEWGRMEVQFTPLQIGWIPTLLESPLARLILVTLTLGFLVYTLFIRRALHYLDPSAVVPGRVKAALDLLVEGVVLLDAKQYIVLANNAFSDMAGISSDELIGQPLSKLNWGEFKREADNPFPLPWEHTKLQDSKLQGVRLLLHSKIKGMRVLSTNISAIYDGKGKQRGMMVTFDDISEVERANRELKATVSQLEKAEIKIRGQNDELRRLASVDPLTNTMNRRAFFEKLNTEFILAKQENLIVSCIMVDIDHFKKINDTYGHAVGDEVIKGIANILIEHCGKNGAVGRYGGEEFCIVLPQTNLDRAAVIAEKIRELFLYWSEVKDSPTNGKTITASLGVSAINLGAKDPAAMIDQADQALYHSKTNGRNQVTKWFDQQQVHSKVS